MFKIIVTKKQITIVLIIIILLISSVASFIKFYSFNPISSFVGFMLIMCTDTEYFVIQRIPYKVILAKSDVSLVEYMQERGFELYDQGGAIHIFQKGNKEECVVTHGNGYFTRWRWE